MKTVEIELALSTYFDCRRNLIVPNVSWGLYLKNKPLHECDLLVCTGSNYLYEIEIKISKADLIADKKKLHGHHHPSIKRLYFALPGNLVNESTVHYIPERAGIITVARTTAGGIITNLFRKPKNNMTAESIRDKDRLKLAHLGCMRIWGLKRKTIK